VTEAVLYFKTLRHDTWRTNEILYSTCNIA